MGTGTATELACKLRFGNFETGSPDLKANGKPRLSKPRNKTAGCGRLQRLLLSIEQCRRLCPRRLPETPYKHEQVAG